jgi:hypothetical protein
VRHISRQLLQALAQLHGERRVAHMALRPENVCCGRPFESVQGIGFHLRRLQRGWGGLWQRLRGEAEAGAGAGAGEGEAAAGGSPGSSGGGGDHYCHEADLQRQRFSLVDFGRARRLEAGGGGGGGEEGLIIFGHPGYRPPEVRLCAVPPLGQGAREGCLQWA